MKIDVLELIKWIALAIALGILIWWLFGDSPTLEQAISSILPLFFLFLALDGKLSSFKMRRATKLAHDRQTKVLYEIRDLLKKK